MPGPRVSFLCRKLGLRPPGPGRIMRSVGQLEGRVTEETAVTAWTASSDHDELMSCVYRVPATGMMVPT
jgi:hypothetical protein